ncbi:MAG: hypothetical protein JWM80_2212 [Cyanobacteria bacterium RYN_339]|nr:hypothetical protein [Cyanobacteria bacterium RYN_339]
MSDYRINPTPQPLPTEQTGPLTAPPVVPPPPIVPPPPPTLAADQNAVAGNSRRGTATLSLPGLTTPPAPPAQPAPAAEEPDAIDQAIETGKQVKDAGELIPEAKIPHVDLGKTGLAGALAIPALGEDAAKLESGFTDLLAGNLADGSLKVADAAVDATSNVSDIAETANTVISHLPAGGSSAPAASTPPAEGAPAPAASTPPAEGAPAPAASTPPVEGAPPAGASSEVANAGRATSETAQVADEVAEGSKVAKVVAATSETLGKLAGPLAIAGGGIQAVTALTGDPPDYKEAALGGANVVAGALMLCPPPADIAGAVLGAGLAIYQNWDTIKDVGAKVGNFAKDAAVEVATDVKDAAVKVEHVAEAAVDKVKDVASSVISSLNPFD